MHSYHKLFLEKESEKIVPSGRLQEEICEEVVSLAGLYAIFFNISFFF